MVLEEKAISEQRIAFKTNENKDHELCRVTMLKYEKCCKMSSEKNQRFELSSLLDSLQKNIDFSTINSVSLPKKKFTVFSTFQLIVQNGSKSFKVSR